MSDLFGISISALQAFQTAISVTSNNIANANTPGYSVETANLTAAVPQTNGLAPIGSGVLVSGVIRAYSQLAENQYNTSQSNLGQLNSLQTYTNQIDNIVGTTAGGLTTSLQSYYNAWSTLATNPTSTANRQGLLSQAQNVASSFQTTNTQLQNLNANINTSITSDVSQVNSIVKSIGTLNQQIVAATAQAGGQAPNELLDQRDQLVSNLSQLANVSTTTDSNGAMNVFIGGGIPLVLQGQTTMLTTVPNQFNASQLEVSSTIDSGNPISSQITGGDLGGLLAARTTAVDPTINQLGQLAVALASSANTQQNSGMDLTGNIGANLFSVGQPTAVASNANPDGTTASVSISNLGGLTADSYVLSYRGGTYSMTNAATGSAVTFTSTGTTSSPSFSVDGLTVSLSGTPASGDQFLIQPTANAAGGFSVALSGTSQLAAAAALKTTAAASNAGNAAISTVTNTNNQPLPPTTTIAFTSTTTYTINGGPLTGVLAANGTTTLNGWQLQFTGTPAVGDQFTLASNAGASGDNTNALANANQQNTGVLSNKTVSINGAIDAFVTSTGSLAAQTTSSQTAQSAVNTQALQTLQSTSGVNLDQEAANLVKWQQAYQASAQALAIGNQLFTTLFNSINGTYS